MCFVKSGIVENGFFEGKGDNIMGVDCKFDSSKIVSDVSSNVSTICGNVISQLRDDILKSKGEIINEIMAYKSSNITQNSLNGTSGSLPDHTKIIFIFSNDIFEVISSFFIVNGQDSSTICYLVKNLNTNSELYIPASFISEISSDLIENVNGRWQLKREDK